MLIAFLYDIFRIKRKAIKTRSITIYIEDLIYWIIASLVMFGVVYYSNDGEIRGFILFGTVTGVITYILLFSRIVIKLSLLIIEIISRVLKFIWIVLTYPFRVIFKILRIPLGFLARVSRKTFRRVKSSGRSKVERMAIWSRLFRNIIKKI